MDRHIKRLGALAGVVGPLLLAAYFGAPALTGWPFAGASPERLTAYANSHQLLFYAGGWLQATGSVLCVAFFLVLLRMSETRDPFITGLVLVGSRRPARHCSRRSRPDRGASRRGIGG